MKRLAITILMLCALPAVAVGPDDVAADYEADSDLKWWHPNADRLTEDEFGNDVVIVSVIGRDVAEQDLPGRETYIIANNSSGQVIGYAADSLGVSATCSTSYALLVDGTDVDRKKAIEDCL